MHHYFAVPEKFALMDSVANLIKAACSVTRLGDFLDIGQLLKPLATINLPKSPILLGNFFKGVKIFNFSSEIISGQLL